MKVLHVTPFYAPAPAHGGMPRCSAALCRALARRGHSVTVVTARLSAAEPEAAEEGGVRVRRFPGPAALLRRLVPFAPGLEAYLRPRVSSFDVAHVHGHRSGIALTACRVLAEARVPWVFLANGTYPHHGQRRVAKLAFDHGLGAERVVSEAAALVAVSEAEAAELPRPARVIPNGVEACGRAERPPRAGAARLLFVGTDAFRRKRAEALAPLLEALPGAQLALVGRFRPAFLARLDRRFGRRVEAAGVLEGDDLAGAYAAADVLVHPAVGEAFGLVPFEAALCGTPAVVAGGHGCGEWFGRAGGCVVPPDDPGALLAAVGERLHDPARGAREAARVAAFAREALSWERVAAEMEAVYAEVAARRPA